MSVTQGASSPTGTMKLWCRHCRKETSWYDDVIDGRESWRCGVCHCRMEQGREVTRGWRVPPAVWQYSLSRMQEFHCYPSRAHMAAWSAIDEYE